MPFSVLRPRAANPVLLVCDHASDRVPATFAELGLTRAQIGQHIGWDIGAAAITRHLSDDLRATAVLSGVSRLVIDCNRPLDDPTSIPPVSDGTEVPGNRAVPPDAAARRAADWFHPYHDAIDRQLARLERRHPVATLISIHTFTPAMNGRARPWPIGVLWNRDPRLAPALIAALRRMGHDAGDNEPYSGRLGGYTIDAHAVPQGRPHVTFEVRQDLLADAAGARHWARILTGVLRPTLNRPELGERRLY